MCPDRELLSAYVDGEVPSPWRERIAEHLSGCPDCAAVVESYAALGRALRADALPGESEALERIRARLDDRLAELEDPSARPDQAARVSAKREFWKRSIQLPLPIAAAAALLVVALGGTTAGLALGAARSGSTRVADRPAFVSPNVLSAAPSISSPAVQPTSMEELLRFLDAHDAQVTITMNLPMGTRFDDSGEPVIIRASQESRGTAKDEPIEAEGRRP
jgi:anti-sigma factor RsiW